MICVFGLEKERVCIPCKNIALLYKIAQLYIPLGIFRV